MAQVGREHRTLRLAGEALRHVEVLRLIGREQRMLQSPQTVSLLQQMGLFAHTGAEAMRSFIAHLSERNVERGALVFREGDPATTLFIVRSGFIRVVKHGPEDKMMALRVAGPGDVVGEVAILDGSPYPASAIATEDTVVLKLARSDLFALLKQNPEAALDIISVLVNRLRNTYENMCGIATESVERRVGEILRSVVDLMSLGSIPGRILIPLTRQDIAEMVGCAKETVSRSMSRMKQLGIVEGSRGKVIIVSAEKLRRFCDDQ